MVSLGTNPLSVVAYEKPVPAGASTKMILLTYNTIQYNTIIKSNRKERGYVTVFPHLGILYRVLRVVRVLK